MASKTHIMLLPYPYQGHMNPVVQFAKRLASKGLRVTLVAPTTRSTNSMQPKTSSINIEYISYDFDKQEITENSDPVEARVARHKLIVSEHLPVLIHKQNESGQPVKFLVYDPFVPWTLELAKQLGLQAGTFFTQSCAVSAIYYHMLQGTPDIPTDGSLVSLPSIPLLDIFDLPSFVYDMGSYPAILRVVTGQF